MAVLAEEQMSVSGVPNEWTLADGKVMDVKRWPNTHRSEKWMKHLKNLPDIPTGQADAAKYAKEHGEILDPHAAGDYLILRSKNQIAKCGGSKCPLTYDYVHMFVIAGDKFGAPQDVEAAVHARYSRLCNKLRLRGKNSRLISNFFEECIAPDQTEALLPRYSTKVSSFETFLRQSKNAPIGKTAAEIRELQVRAHVHKNAFDVIEELPTEFNTGGDEPVAPPPKRVRPSAKAAQIPKEATDTEMAAAPAPTRVRSRPPATKNGLEKLRAFVTTLAPYKPDNVDAKTAIGQLGTKFESIKVNSRDAWNVKKKKLNIKMFEAMRDIAAMVPDAEKQQLIRQMVLNLKKTVIDDIVLMETLELVAASVDA